VGRLEAEVGAEPALDRRQRTNVGLVLFVSQALQVLVVTAAFFVAFGALAIGPRIIESWLGVPASCGVRGLRRQGTRHGGALRVAGGVAALSGLYFSVALMTNSAYREEFLDELTEELRVVFADRARYLALRR